MNILHLYRYALAPHNIEKIKIKLTLYRPHETTIQLRD